MSQKENLSLLIFNDHNSEDFWMNFWFAMHIYIFFILLIYLILVYLLTQHKKSPEE